MKNLSYAVIQTGGKQYKVREGDEITVDGLSKSQGDRLDFSPLLLVRDKDKVHIGRPEVKDGSVEATIIDHILGKKIHVSTYKAKTRNRRKIGFRPKLTRLKIDKIKYP